MHIENNDQCFQHGIKLAYACNLRLEDSSQKLLPILIVELLALLHYHYVTVGPINQPPVTTSIPMFCLHVVWFVFSILITEVCMFY